MSSGISAYSPLPQSNSDSDGSSEEELHVSREDRIINRAVKVHNSTGDKGYNEHKNNVINYKPLDNNCDVGIALNKFQSNTDEVSVLKPDANSEIFSTSRKICFVLSLFLCVFTTVAFIWLLPCNVDSCPSASDFKKHNFTWEENLPNLEIYGPITLSSDEGGSHNLIFLTNSYPDSKKNYSENGLMCLKGRDGSLKWKVKLDEESADLDCKLIDINADGISDCLMLGRNVLRAINPLSGNELWDIQKSNNKEEKKINFEDFPLIIPDMNRDDIKELLLACSLATGELGNSFQNYLVIISGKTGQIINKPLQMKLCIVIKDLMFDNNSTLSFTCFNSEKKMSFQKISLTKLYKTLKYASEGKINKFKWGMLNQHVGNSAVIHINGFRLNLENQGPCPENCVVLVDVKDEHSGSRNKTLFHFSRKSTFGMAPVVLKTKKEVGFVLKFWKWHSETEKSFQNDADFPIQKTVVIKDTMRNIIKRSNKVNRFLNSSNLLDNEMLSESEWESQQRRRRRVVRPEKSALSSAAFSLHVITESILKINFKSSRLIISNVTKDEIIQICRRPGICQPNANKQRHSVLVADFGEYGEKLITFSSKYVHNNKKSSKNSEDWYLQSRIRVLNI